MNRDRLLGGAAGAGIVLAVLLAIGLTHRGCHGPQAPSDALSQQIRAAYDNDAGRTKAADALAIAGALRSVDANDPDIATTGELYRVAVAACGKVTPHAPLQGVSSIVAAHLGETLGIDPAKALTPSLRKTAAAEFQRIATALEYAAK